MVRAVAHLRGSTHAHIFFLCSCVALVLTGFWILRCSVWNLAQVFIKNRRHASLFSVGFGRLQLCLSRSLYCVQSGLFSASNDLISERCLEHSADRNEFSGLNSSSPVALWRSSHKSSLAHTLLWSGNRSINHPDISAENQPLEPEYWPENSHVSHRKPSAASPVSGKLILISSDFHVECLSTIRD